mgnify:FL=1
MDRSDVIELVTVTKTQDEYGIWRTSETTKKVFCQVDSVTQSEFFEAGRNGLNPEFRFTVFFGDYSNEPIVIYKGNRYAVYRTYLTRNDRLELHVERKGGTNGESDT